VGSAYAFIEKLLKHQHFEETQRIYFPLTRIAFVLLLITFLLEWAKLFQRDRFGESLKNRYFNSQLFNPLLLVPEAYLAHIPGMLLII